MRVCVATLRPSCGAVLTGTGLGCWCSRAAMKENGLPSSDWPRASPRTSQDTAVAGAGARGPERPSRPLWAPPLEGCLLRVRGEMSGS